MSGKGGGVETPGGGGWCPDIFWGLGFRGDGVFGNVKNGIFHLVYCGFSFTLRFARNSRGKKIWCWRKDALRKRSRPVDFLVPNVNDIGYLFCRVLSWFLTGGFLNSCVRCKNSPQNCRSSGTSDLVRAMDTLVTLASWRGFGEKTHSHHFVNLPYKRTKNCLIPGIKMHKSLRYQKAQQEMVDIQHFNQQEREDCQNCKTRLSYCRISAVVSGKAIPTNGLVNRSLLDVPFSTLIITFPSHTVLRRLPLPLEIGSSQDMLSMIRELRQTLKLKVCATKSADFSKDGMFRWTICRGKSRFLSSLNLSIFGGWNDVCWSWSALEGTHFLKQIIWKTCP